MEKLFIKNRKGQKMAVVVECAEIPPPSGGGLAFVMHGLGGFKEQPHIQAMAEVFLEHGYTVVRFDTTNTFGGSDGNYENATTTNYYADLEDVIAWAGGLSFGVSKDSPPQPQPWYQEPFVLAGHSLGGLCTALYAQRHPEKVKALAPLGTVVSGKLSMETPRRSDTWQEWKRTGWEEHESASKPGVIKRLPWSHMEDRLKYDLLPEVHKLTMPVLLVVGERDESCPPEHQKILYAALPGPKELHIIPGAPHTFRDPKHLEELKSIIEQWIQKLEK